MLRRVLPAAAVVALLLVGMGAVAASRTPALSASGPVTIGGTEAAAPFRLGDRVVRQVRYVDRETLDYRFVLTNAGRLPVTVTDVAPVGNVATLLRLEDVRAADGDAPRIGAGDSVEVVLEVLMTDCERLSARAASLVSEVQLTVEGLVGRDHTVTVALPEELRVGSAREMFCPRATAKSRPPG